MLVEGEGRAEDFTPLFAPLHPYSRPKHVFFVPELPRAGSGKPDRAKARLLARKLTEERHG
jgi:acyl-CoA synthetase (AMP-forming)/AMP-acid ligase II